MPFQIVAPQPVRASTLVPRVASGSTGSGPSPPSAAINTTSVQSAATPSPTAPTACPSQSIIALPSPSRLDPVALHEFFSVVNKLRDQSASSSHVDAANMMTTTSTVSGRMSTPSRRSMHNRSRNSLNSPSPTLITKTTTSSSGDGDRQRRRRRSSASSIGSTTSSLFYSPPHQYRTVSPPMRNLTRNPFVKADQYATLSLRLAEMMPAVTASTTTTPLIKPEPQHAPQQQQEQD